MTIPALLGTLVVLPIVVFVPLYHLDRAKKNPLHKWHKPLVNTTLLWIILWSALGILARSNWPSVYASIAPFQSLAVIVPFGLLVALMGVDLCQGFFKSGRSIASLPTRFAVQTVAVWGVMASLYLACSMLMLTRGLIA